MTKGIRQFAKEVFAADLASRTEIGNTEFRRGVMAQVMAAFDGVSNASAATHYNYAFQSMKLTNPELVEGLGRAADKKGGRKPLHVFNVVKVKDGVIVKEGVSKATGEKIVAAAVEAKKTKLMLVEVPKVEAVAETEEAVAA